MPVAAPAKAGPAQWQQTILQAAVPRGTNCVVAGWTGSMFEPDDSPEKVAEILNQFPGPAMLYPSKLTWIPNLLLMMPIMIGLGAWGLWMFVTEGGLFHLLIGGLLFEAIRVTTGFIVGAMWLRLDAQGFEARFAGPCRRRNWGDVAEFTTWMIRRWWPFVAYADRTPPKWWELSRIFYFWGNAWFRDTYGLSAKDLANLMNAWRERALAQPQ
jgi:hypothetical protein